MADSEVCVHAETFECFDTLWCSACHVDSYLLADGTRFWPSQEPLATWTTDRVASWFLGQKIHWLSQGCEGFTFCRYGKGHEAHYGYVWVEATLDLDMDMAWLLDVRRGVPGPFAETRQYITVFSDGRPAATHPDITAFLDCHTGQTVRALHWFADQVDSWLNGKVL